VLSAALLIGGQTPIGIIRVRPLSQIVDGAIECTRLSGSYMYLRPGVVPSLKEIDFSWFAAS